MAQGRAHGRSEVLKCLLAQLDGLQPPCQEEIGRAARMALWEYTPGATRRLLLTCFKPGRQQTSLPCSSRLQLCLICCALHQSSTTVSAFSSPECMRVVQCASKTCSLRPACAGAALTACCDHDVHSTCEAAASNHKRGVFTIGAVGRCLAKHLAVGTPMEPECRELVLAAAPGVRGAVFQSLY